jgi:hypothetical protein
MVCYCCGNKAYEMMLWEPGTKVVCCGSKIQEMLLLWEQDPGDVVAVGTRHCIAENAQDML